METWQFLLLEAAVAVCLLLMSRQQPFPGPSRRMGWLVMIIFGIFALGETAPRPVSIFSHLVTILVIGALGLIRGINNMLITRREVLVAPFAGILFCAGAIGMMIEEWENLSSFEQIAAFATVVVLMGIQTWLVFRGLLIGRLPLAWSQAGIVALQRGLIEGHHGAIWCFERAWDLEEEHLNPMAWVALERINRYLGRTDEADHWRGRSEESGGEEAVAEEWLQALDSALSNLSTVSE